MSHHFHEDEPATLGLALGFMKGEDLRKLAALTKQKVPSKNAEMAALIVRHLTGNGLRAVWEGLDELQQAAVSEAVHSPSSQLNSQQFRAKYGGDPNWGAADPRGYGHKPSPLGA